QAGGDSRRRLPVRAEGAGRQDRAKTVTEERVIGSQIYVASTGDDRVRFFQNTTITSPALKHALQRALELRWAAQQTQREVGELQRQMKVITDDRDRLRANRKEMPATAAYQRYREKFDQQESQIEKLQADAKQLQATGHRQQPVNQNGILSAWSSTTGVPVIA